MDSSPRFSVQWPEVAHGFIARYAQVEGGLKRAGFLKKGKKVAEADWLPLANALGSLFYDEILASGKANTLLAEPPRTRMSDGFAFMPERPRPIENVQELLAAAYVASDIILRMEKNSR